MAKRLNDTKVFQFKGISSNIDPLADKNSVRRSTNTESHHKPGILTLRQPYELRYPKPNDVFQRPSEEDFISFDNFYEKTALDQAEVTILVSKAVISAPLISGSRASSYQYNSINIYARPYWTGSFWKDDWLWLNEPFISKVTVAPDVVYGNKIRIAGYIDNMLQWSLINITKDKSTPYAVIRSATNGSNTDLWLSVYNPNFEVDDVVVLMRNYIPIKYLLQNYNVLREEIHFHRIFSRIRIGFGAKEGRIALGIEYVHNTLRLADYNFTATDPTLDELLFANVNRMIVQPYAAFNEDREDFRLQIISSAGGTFIAGKHFFRMTALYGGDEFLVDEKEITIDVTSLFTISPQIRLGSLSRRTSELKVYYSENGDDYYLWKNYVVVSDGDTITAPDFVLNNEGYLEAVINITGTELNTEDSAVSAADINDAGSWIAQSALGNITLTVIAATNFAIDIEIASGDFRPYLELPGIALERPLYAGKTYTIEVVHKNTGMSGTFSNVSVYIEKGVRPAAQAYFLGTLNYSSSYDTYSLTFVMPSEIVGDPNDYKLSLRMNYDSRVAAIRHYTLESFSIIEEGSETLNAFNEVTTNMLEEMGYQATFNLVRDWQNACILNGRTFVGAAYIDKRYNTNVFYSEISGSSANMHDVIPAGSTYPIDEYRGEVITGLIVLHNLNLAAFTDAGLVILDPNTGNTFEVARGFGLVVKGSLMLFRGTVIYGSTDDFIRISAATGYEPIVLSSDSTRDIYNKLTGSQKLQLTACFDRYGAYRVSLAEDAETKELLLTDRGWHDQEREHHPQVYRNGLGGRVWFLNDGDIYAYPFAEEDFVGYADLYGDYRAGW